MKQIFQTVHFNEPVQEMIKRLFYIIRRKWNILKTDNSRFNELVSWFESHSKQISPIHKCIGSVDSMKPFDSKDHFFLATTSEWIIDWFCESTSAIHWNWLKKVFFLAVNIEHLKHFDKICESFQSIYWKHQTQTIIC